MTLQLHFSFHSDFVFVYTILLILSQLLNIQQVLIKNQLVALLVAPVLLRVRILGNCSFSFFLISFNLRLVAHYASVGLSDVSFYSRLVLNITAFFLHYLILIEGAL